MNKKASGSGFLKVTSIILIVFACIGLISALFTVVTVLIPMMNGTLDESVSSIYEQLGMTVQTTLYSVIISLVQVILYFIVSIFGIKNCNNLEKAQICFAMGIILIAWELILAAYNAVMAGVNVFSIITVVFSLILPLLYFWGALKNRQEAMDAQ